MGLTNHTMSGISDLIIESEYGSYLGLKESIGLNESIEFSMYDNYDIIESASCKVILAKTSRIAGDDLGNIFGINLYRKCPTLEEALHYNQALPEALGYTTFTGNLAFAAKDEQDYLAKKNVYDNFYSEIFSESEDPKFILVAPHCGDIRYKSDEFRISPKDGIDKWTARLTADLFDTLVNCSPNSRVIVFLHTSSDYFKSYPAVIDLGDMGFNLPNGFETFLNKLNKKYHSFFNSKKRGYQERVFYQTRKNSIRKNIGSKSINQYMASADSKRLQEWGLTLDWFKYNSPDQFVSITSTTEQFIRINHQFSGRKVATLIPHSRKFDWCFQVECSEYFLENKNETISQILSEIVQFITNENGEYNGKN